MLSDIQLGNFTHGKCLNCGYFSRIDYFNEDRKYLDGSDPEKGIEAYQLILICPICGFDGCEALYANEVN